MKHPKLIWLIIGIILISNVLSQNYPNYPADPKDYPADADSIKKLADDLVNKIQSYQVEVYNDLSDEEKAALTPEERTESEKVIKETKKPEENKSLLDRIVPDSTGGKVALFGGGSILLFVIAFILIRTLRKPKPTGIGGGGQDGHKKVLKDLNKEIEDANEIEKLLPKQKMISEKHLSLAKLFAQDDKDLIEKCNKEFSSQLLGKVESHLDTINKLFLTFDKEDKTSQEMFVYLKRFISQDVAQKIAAQYSYYRGKDK